MLQVAGSIPRIDRGNLDIRYFLSTLRPVSPALGITLGIKLHSTVVQFTYVLHVTIQFNINILLLY